MSFKIKTNLLKRKTFRNVTSIEDAYIMFYRIHFALLEEKFYVHLSNLIISPIDIPLKLMTSDNLGHKNELDRYTLELKGNFSDLGCCFLGTDNSNGEKVILKHIINSPLTATLSALLQSCKSLSQIQSENILKVVNTVLFRSNTHGSLWYVFEYNESIDLETLKSSLHHKVLGYQTESESEFVHLLYSCNGILDQSKEKFPEFFNIVRYIAGQLLMGLFHLHKQGIIHKDLSPSNIRMTTKGILKITDLGLAKQFRWYKYDSRSHTDNMMSYKFYKESTKRLLLNGSYFYTEPRVRSIINKDLSFDEKCHQIELFGFQLDYFSCSMVLFELTFGFTYGDLSLYKKYSFYEPLIKCELIFYFPEYYIPIFDKFPNLSLVLEEFSKLQLKNLKNYMMYHGDGFVDFLMEGLSTDLSRWSQYITKVNGKHNFDFVKLRTQIPFFKDFNFSNILSNTPEDFLHFLQSAMSPSSQNLEIKTCEIPSDIEEVVTDFDIPNDSNSFYIPEFPINAELNVSKVCKSILKQTQPTKPKPNVIHSNSNSKVNCSNSIRFAIKSNKKPFKKDDIDEKVYTSVFVHKLFDNLQKRHFEHDFRNGKESPIKNVNIEENVNISCLNESNNICVAGKNVMEKQCPLHVKHPQTATKNASILTEQCQTKPNLIKKKSRLDIHKNEKYDRGVSNDFTSISDYQIQQYRLNSSRILNRKDLVECNQINRNRSHSMDDGDKILNKNLRNPEIEPTEILRLQSHILQTMPTTAIKSICTFGSSGLAKGDSKNTTSKDFNQVPVELNTFCYPKSVPIEMSLKSYKSFQRVTDEVCKPDAVKIMEKRSCSNPQINSQKSSLQINHCNKVSNEATTKMFLLDSSVIDPLLISPVHINPKNKTKDCKDLCHDYFENTPYTSFPVLFGVRNSKTPIQRKFPQISVTAMSSKEVQTSDNFDEYQIQDQIVKNIMNIKVLFAVENDEFDYEILEIIEFVDENIEIIVEETIEDDVQMRYKEVIHVQAQRVFCCDQNSYILISINDVEESLENSETNCEKLNDSLNNNLFVVEMLPQRTQLSKKSVTFKFPVITDIFDLDSLKQFEAGSSNGQLKSILKENDEYSDQAYFFRSKVSDEGMEIIDDWITYDEIVSKDLNKDSDLNTIGEDYLLSSFSSSLPVPKATERFETNKEKLEELKDLE